MAGGFNVKLEGLEKVLKKINKEAILQDITDELAAFGFDVERDAKQIVPVDEGFLKNSITSIPKRLSVEIVANCDYAAYVEFGTRKFAAIEVATLPPALQLYAARFKGKSSSLADGMRARPYLYPSFEKNRVKLLERLKNVLNNPR